MSLKRSIDRICSSFDDDALLSEALSDVGLPIVRRVLAGIAIGYPVDDAHYGAHHLHEALSLAAADDRSGSGDAIGAAMLDHMLRQPSDHYVTALWAVVVDHGYETAAGHLAWLVELLRARGAAATLAIRAGRPVTHFPRVAGDLYVDGPDSSVEPIEALTGSFKLPR